MDRALSLAERGGGGTAPNPMVGCVIADGEGNVLAEGFHRRAGEAHAEVVALEAAAAAGRDVRGATAVVTLEPCAHHGRTPPCADALLAAGIGRVVFAVEDPHAGKGGAERLAAAGIAVESGLRRREAERLVEPWLHFVGTGRPFFHLKSAITLNGRLTRGAGGPRWVTGEEARRAVHRLRRLHPAVVIGIGTALADDPLLTVRDWPPAEEPDPAELAGGESAPESPGAPWPPVQPLRVVLDSGLRLPPGSKLAATAADSPVLVLAAADAPPDREEALVDRGVLVERVAVGEKGLELPAVADALAARGVTGALVEPGPRLAAGLLEAGLADRWTVFVAPLWETAADAPPLLGADRPALALRDATWERHGADASVSGRLGRLPDRAV
jgi:diaminohydroxyphosphoribosylaminopyrimidine deaminase/5-amino-6-(5-phosphoribosylamino)uracil reductase